MDFLDPVPPPRVKKKEKIDNSPVVSSKHRDKRSDQVCDVGQDHTSGQDHMITNEDHMITKDHSEDHMITEDHIINAHMITKDHVDSRSDHMTNEKQNHKTSSEDSLLSKTDHPLHKQTHAGDHVIPDASNSTMYFEAASHISLHGNGNDVTDGGNSYDVQKELDEILSKSELVDGTHLDLPTQVTMTSTDATNTITTTTTAAAAGGTTNTVVMGASVADMDTSTSLTKSDHGQSSSSTNSKSDKLDLPSNAPMSDSVKLCVSVCVHAYCVCVCVCLFH